MAIHFAIAVVSTQDSRNYDHNLDRWPSMEGEHVSWSYITQEHAGRQIWSTIKKAAKSLGVEVTIEKFYKGFTQPEQTPTVIIWPTPYSPEWDGVSERCQFGTPGLVSKMTYDHKYSLNVSYRPQDVLEYFASMKVELEETLIRLIQHIQSEATSEPVS